MYLMNATRPLEFVCFHPVEFETLDGDAYCYIAVDVYSKALFLIGIDVKNDTDTVLKHVDLLMKNTDFKKQMHNGFTLVFHKYAGVQTDIENIIKPHKGNMSINDPLVTKEVTPVMLHLFEALSKNNQ